MKSTKTKANWNEAVPTPTMPPLSVFDGQDLALIAGDDLRVLAKIVFAFRLCQTFILAPAGIGLFIGRENQGLLWAFWSISAVNISISVIMETLTFFISSQGSPVDEARRKHLPLVCTAKIIPFSLLSLVSMVLGCCLINRNNLGKLHCTSCPQRTQRALLTLAYSHIVELIAVAAVALFLLCQRPFLFRWSVRTFAKSNGDGWRCICRWMFTCSRYFSCCLLGGAEVLRTSKGASFLTEISVILGEYFDAGGIRLDVTPTDLLAGVAALSAEERNKREKRPFKLQIEEMHNQTIETDLEECAVWSTSLATGDFDEQLATSESLDSEVDDIVVSPEGTRRKRKLMVKTVRLRRDAWDAKGYFSVAERAQLLPENHLDREVILDGSHYMRLAHAVYGFVMLSTKAKWSTPCLVLAEIMKCNSRSFNKLAFLQLSGCEHADLVFLSSDSSIEACPYGIVIDRVKKSIVVVIRGTLSLEDAVADLNLIPQALRDHAGRCPELEGQNGHCHGGILQNVLWIYEDLQRRGLLESCLDQFGGFQLVCTGHSLGAGCAAILSIILRRRFRRLVKCLCFSPPGCVMSEDICSDPFMTSYILESDVVPRLSVSSLDSFRNDVLETIARIKVPKHCVDRGKDASQILHPASAIPDSRFYQQLQAFRAHRELSRKARISERVKLCLPGKSIVHLVKASSPISSTAKPGSWISRNSDASQVGKKEICYAPVWAEREDFAEITLRKNLMIDHLPWRVLNQLDRVTSTF